MTINIPKNKMSDIKGPLNRLYMRIRWLPSLIGMLAIIPFLLLLFPVWIIMELSSPGFFAAFMDTIERIFQEHINACDAEIAAYKERQRDPA